MGEPDIPYHIILIAVVLILPFLPIYWILIILNGVRKIVFEEIDVKDAIAETAEQLGFAVWGPFIAILYPLLCIIKMIVEHISEVKQNMWKKRPSISKRWDRALDVEGGLARAENVPLLKKSYQYSPLGGELEIRLLIIYPGSFKDPIQGEIITVNLLWRPTYDALSYTWADEAGNQDRSRTIRCVKDGSTIHITRNCEIAIQRLRLRNKKRRVWIDAVCINQDSDIERNQQVSLMSRIYVTARNVVVYTGEGTTQTGMLFDWLNSLDQKDLNIPSIERFEDIDEAGLGILTGASRFWNELGATKVWINEMATKFERCWKTIQRRCSSSVRKSGSSRKMVLPESILTELVSDYFSRRWFKRVWVLQEVALPGLHKTKVLCGNKVTTGERALHLFSLLKDQGSGIVPQIFVLLRRRIEGLKRSHLLDILIETRDHECEDSRDKIFGVLSIARGMDKGRFPELKANYEQATPTVYAYFSVFFIRHHGVGFFLSLIKYPSKLRGLPSWAADWTVPWPNCRAVRGRDFAAGSRSAKIKDTGAEFDQENGWEVLKIHRPKILRGHFTRDGHMDDSSDMHIEDVQHVPENEVLIEMYPGLAALLRKEGEYYVFIRVCPHALSYNGVEKLVSNWSCVVVDGDGPEEQMGQSIKTLDYLSLPETFKIR
jgi:heterokaryon incompatibility protein (HET)